MKYSNCFWINQAFEKEKPNPTPLQKDIDVDVCIVGGGYTGLWTAINLKKEQPEKSIAIIEQKFCGYGASGSNGGCVLTLATKYTSLVKFYGKNEAKRLVKASEKSIQDIKIFCNKHNIECGLKIDGALYIATNYSQVGTMQKTLDALDEEEINSWKKWELEKCYEYAGTKSLSEGFYSPNAGSVQPALLVRGMARVAKEMGIAIYEDTPMEKLIETATPQVKTPKGTVTAKKVVLATGAWMASKFKKFERTMTVVSSDMTITEPCPELLDKIGLKHGGTVCDSRIFVNYYHRTIDDRLMLGKGGNVFAYGCKMLPYYFEKSAYEGQLRDVIQRFLPELKEVKLATSWNGGSDRTKNGFPIFGTFEKNKNILYGYGYSGNGVAQSYLGGKILSSMVLEKNDQWSNTGFVGGTKRKFPPEPFRYYGALMVRNAIRRKEKVEDLEKQPLWIDKQFAKLAKAAGKADK